jgi:hypothetical protein
MGVHVMMTLTNMMIILIIVVAIFLTMRVSTAAAALMSISTAQATATWQRLLRTALTCAHLLPLSRQNFCNDRAGYRLYCLLPRLRANGRFTGLFKTTSVAEYSCCFLRNRRNIWPISVLLCVRAAATATTTPSATLRVKQRAVVTLGTQSCCA